MGWKLTPGDEQLKGGREEREVRDVVQLVGRETGHLLRHGFPAPTTSFLDGSRGLQGKGKRSLLLLGEQALPGPQLCFLTRDVGGLVPPRTAVDAKITQAWLLC